MAVESHRRLANFLVLAVMLAAIILGLGALIYLARDAILHTEDLAIQKLLARLAWISLTLMGLALVLLLAATMQFVRSRLPRGRHAKTPYVDAWALAGKRLKLEDHDDEPPAAPPQGDQRT